MTTKMILLFDVDGTLTKPRSVITPVMQAFLKEINKKVPIGLVGGSDMAKIEEQMGTCIEKFEYVFSENGLIAFKKGKQITDQSLLKFAGEEKLQKIINFSLRYLSELELPHKRGTFIEFRKGMLNVCPAGRNVNQEERDHFVQYDKEHNVRAKMIDALKENFKDSEMTFAIGGQISIDVFPIGWDKTYCLKTLVDEGFTEIHFFGDKTAFGGNDYEIFNDPRTQGHTVADPDDTMKQVKAILGI